MIVIKTVINVRKKDSFRSNKGVKITFSEVDNDSMNGGKYRSKLRWNPIYIVVIYNFRERSSPILVLLEEIYNM